MTSGKSTKDWYLASFEVLEKNLNGDASSDIQKIRKAAIIRFAELGFPTTRVEEWKYTDVSPITKINFKTLHGVRTSQVTHNDLVRLGFSDFPSYHCTFIDGLFSPDHSLGSSKQTVRNLVRLPEGVKIGSLADALKNDAGILLNHLTRYAHYDENPFTALSTAFLYDGAFVFIPDGVIMDVPIHLMFISTTHEKEHVTHPRNLIVVGRNSQVKIIETYVTLANDTYFTNTVSEIVLGENAVVEHVKFQNESTKAFHIGSTYVQQSRSSNYTSHVISMGGSLVRNNVFAVLDGEGAESTLNGLYLGTDNQHIDNHTTIDHAKPHCNSHELYKGILNGKSKGVFNGKIKVRKDAQKTDAKQTNKNLVLSDNASVDTKPQLEIFANDVKCTHGATIGQLDEEAIFYLRSRGVDLKKARDMLIYAFANDVLSRISIEPLKEKLHIITHDRLEQS